MTEIHKISADGMISKKDLDLPLVSVAAEIWYWEYVLSIIPEIERNDFIFKQLRQGCREAIKNKFPLIFAEE